MLIILVQAEVKPPYVEAFKKACIENAQETMKEEDVICFDIVQQQDDPTRFVMIEVYRNRDALSRNKGTPHYRTWRDKVLPMMAYPRKNTFFTHVYPEAKNWS